VGTGYDYVSVATAQPIRHFPESMAYYWHEPDYFPAVKSQKTGEVRPSGAIYVRFSKIIAITGHTMGVMHKPARPQCKKCTAVTIKDAYCL